MCAQSAFVQIKINITWSLGMITMLLIHDQNPIISHSRVQEKFNNVHTLNTPNAPAHRRRAEGVRLSTETAIPALGGAGLFDPSACQSSDNL